MKKSIVNSVIVTICSFSVTIMGALSSPIIETKSIPESLGVSVHFRELLEDGGWSVNDDQLKSYEKQMDSLVDLGVKVLRIDNAWRWTNKAAGEYDFAPHHRLMDALDKRGLRAMTILCFNDPRFEPQLSIRTEEGRKSYAKFCASIVREFKGRGVIWEMWNEPNLTGFWQPGANVEEYMKAAKLAMAAMRAEDPECLIIAPSPCTIDIPFLQSCFDKGLLETVSAVSVHSYCDAPETMFSRYLHLRNLMANKNIPIVCSEWGFSRVFVGFTNRIRSKEEQASLVVRSVLVDLMSGLPLHIIYTNLDYTEKLEWNEDSFGLIDHKGNPKPAFYAVKNLISTLKDAKFFRQLLAADVLGEVSSNDYAVEFKGNGENIIVAWTTGESHPISVEVSGEPIALQSMTGEKMETPTVKEKRVTLPLSNSPIYLHIKLPK